MNENIIGRRTTAWVEPLMPGSPSPSSSLPRLGFYICFCDLINQSTQGGKGASSERTRILAHLGLPCRGKPAASAPVVLCWWQGWHQLLLFWANVHFRYDPPTWLGSPWVTWTANTLSPSPRPRSKPLEITPVWPKTALAPSKSTSRWESDPARCCGGNSMKAR